MKLFNSKKKKLIAAGVSMVAVAGIATGAVAYFTSTGTGTGTATTGSATNWAVTVTGDNVALDLVPVPTIGNGPSDNEAYAIKNNSAGQQFLTQAVISVDSVVDGPVSGPNACTPSDFSVNGATVGSAFTQAINNNRAAGSTYNNSVSLQLVDNGLNQDRCQGATVHLKVVAS